MLKKNVNLILYYKALALKLWFGTDGKFTERGDVQVHALITFLCYCVFHGNSTVQSCSDPPHSPEVKLQLEATVCQGCLKYRTYINIIFLPSFCAVLSCSSYQSLCLLYQRVHMINGKSCSHLYVEVQEKQSVLVVIFLQWNSKENISLDYQRKLIDCFKTWEQKLKQDSSQSIGDFCAKIIKKGSNVLLVKTAITFQ